MTDPCATGSLSPDWPNLLLLAAGPWGNYGAELRHEYGQLWSGNSKRASHVESQTSITRVRMFDHGFLWVFGTIVGPLLLLAAMVYGVVRSRRRGRASKNQTEEATRNLYREADKQERRRGE